MDFKNKKILVVSTTDDMIGNFMIPHILHMQKLGAVVECACNCHSHHTKRIEELTGAVVHNIPLTRNPFNFKVIKGYFALKKIVKNGNYDLINCLQPVGGFMGRMMAKKFKLPCLYTAHGFHFYKGCPIQNKLIYKTIEKYCAKYTTALVTMNEEDFVASQKMKAEKKYKINGIGVDFSKYKASLEFDKSAFRKSIGLADDDFVVVSVGELNKNKNTLRIVDAMAKVDNPKVKYLICGQGPLKEKYEQKIASLGLGDRVKLMGYRSDIPDLLNCVDCYIMPSFREGLSKAMMEAMTYGLPIICSKIRGNVDLVGDSEGGILVEPSDTDGFAAAIKNMAEDETLRKKMSERNLKEIQKYSLDTVISQLENIYKEI